MAVSKPRPAHLHLPFVPLRASSRDCSPSPTDYLTMNSRPSTPDRVSRCSFSSIRENESILPQTFSSTKISSYLDTEAVIDDIPSTPSPTESTSSFSKEDHKMIQTQTVTAHFQPPVTHPNSKLLGYWTPADSFKGWKEIQVKGKISSKSFGDLQVLHQAFRLTPKPTPKRVGPKPGEAPIERLPTEIITSIINLLAIDIPPNGISRRNVDLMSLLLTSRTLHIATLTTLYSKITIPHSRIFQKFLSHVSAHPTLGTIVRRLDFCHFNPAQLFLTASERSKARNLTSETLLRCLELTPNLQEFLGQEYIDDDLDASVLKKLFLGLDRLQAVDFCGCTSTKFKEAFSSIVSPDWPAELSIRRLSLHKCLTLPASIFEVLLPRLPHLTHLDVAGTRITDAALASIPPTARLTHLNLAKCTMLSARGVIDFLAHHPAAKGLVFLSLATDARSHQLFDAENIAELLPILPKTLKSLSLKGSRMDSYSIDLLRPLTKHLEELSVGRSLSLKDINRLFVPDEDNDDIQMQIDWVPHSLKYLDLSDLWGTELDLVYLFNSNCAILKGFSEPLEVVEIAEDVFKRVTKSAAAVEKSGWHLTECGIRGWMVRQPSKDVVISKKDDGSRGWKMGADSWGMRKIPVARSDVGGMYGSYMFGRKL
ncbi:putative F-box protein [Podospora fimiseda]|uniref:F-box protein n=1 Tax=Podospora fimiseda TaxID=252190 RepID=A0AAN7BKP6_9PEZI|nr:putative F-box protein [Podospora fimiseda]